MPNLSVPAPAKSVGKTAHSNLIPSSVLALAVLGGDWLLQLAARYGWVTQRPGATRYAYVAFAVAGLVWVFGLVPYWPSRPRGLAWLGLAVSVALTQAQAALAATWLPARWPVPPMAATVCVTLLLVVTVALLTRRVKRAVRS